MEGNPQIIPFKNSPDLKMLSRSWPVDDKKGISDKEPPIVQTIKIHPREDVNQWFADPKISWTKPKYDQVYKQFLKRRYREINSLQENLRLSLQPERINELKKDISKREKFFDDIKSYQMTREDLFKLIKQNEKDTNQFQLTPLNNIIDPKRMPSFSSLVFRYEHNTRTPIGNAFNMVNIFKSAPQMFQDEMITILTRNLHDCFDQMDSLFSLLRNPSHQVDLYEFDIDAYLQELKNEYTQIATENQVKLNWIVERDSNADFTTFTNNPKEVKTQILDNLIVNAIQHLNNHRDLTLREINVQVSVSKYRRDNIIKFVVSNPSKITDEQFARLTQFKRGFSTKTDTSERHGVALVEAKELCESALGGEFEITRDAKNYFTTTLTLQDLAKKTNIMQAAA